MNNSVKKCLEYLNRSFSKKEIQMTNKQIKIGSTSLAIKDVF